MGGGPSYTEIGVGFLSLSPATNLIKNDRYSIQIINTEQENDDKNDKNERRKSLTRDPVPQVIPTVVVDIRTFCSYFSSCKNTQAILYASPVPPGYIISSRMIANNPLLLESYHNASMAHVLSSDDQLIDVITNLYLHANENEVKKHFLVLFRICLRSMIGNETSTSTNTN